MLDVRHGPARSPHYRQGTDSAAFRVVLFVLLLIPLGVVWRLSTDAQRSAPAATSTSSASGEQSRVASLLNPRSLFQEEGRKFLPAPVVALPPETGAGPPAPTTREEAPQAPGERVKVANTGGLGAILRAEPPRGPQVGALRDGQVLEVLERRRVGADDWLRVRTQDNREGWIFGPLVAPA